MTRVNLGDVCEILMGQAPPGESYNLSGNGIPLLAGAGDFGLSYPKPKRFTTEASRLSKPGDILLCVRATIGERNWSDRSYCLGRGVAAIRVCSQELDKAYLWHWLGYARPALEHRARGSTFKQVTRESVESLSLPLPAIAEQRRLAALLDTTDAIRLKRRKSLLLVDDLLRSGYLTIVGPKNPSYGQWPRVEIGDLAERRDGGMRTGPFGSTLRHGEFTDQGEVAVIGIDNAVGNAFCWGQRRFITRERYETNFKRYTVSAGDVLVTIMGTIGRSAVVPEDIGLAISTKHLAVISVDRTRVYPEYLSHAIQMDPAVLAQINSANHGAIMSGLNLGLIRRLRIQLPSMSEQRSFVCFIDRARSLRMGLEDALQCQGSMSKSLMQYAFSESRSPSLPAALTDRSTSLSLGISR